MSFIGLAPGCRIFTPSKIFLNEWNKIFIHRALISCFSLHRRKRRKMGIQDHSKILLLHFRWIWFNSFLHTLFRFIEILVSGDPEGFCGEDLVELGILAFIALMVEVTSIFSGIVENTLGWYRFHELCKAKKGWKGLVYIIESFPWLKDTKWGFSKQEETKQRWHQ